MTVAHIILIKNVTASEAVTGALVVTLKTLAPQRLSPLSPVSPLVLLYTCARDRGFRPTGVTGDSGDGPARIDVSRFTNAAFSERQR